MSVVRELAEKYYILAKQQGSTTRRQECKIKVPAYEFDIIVSAEENAKYYMNKGEFNYKGEGYFETHPGTPCQFYNPDIVTFVRKE